MTKNSRYYILDDKKKKKSGFWPIIIILFVAFIGFLVYNYSNFKNPSGNIVKDGINIDIDSILTPPDNLEIDSSIEKIELKTVSGGFFVGNDKFDLDKASLVIDNYNGKIILIKNKISMLEGTASKVFVQGIPITSSSDMKIYFEKADYSYLKLNNFYLASLNYKTSGIVKLNKGKAVINLYNENIKLEGFQGDLESRGNSFKIKGEIENSNLGLIDVKANLEK